MASTYTPGGIELMADGEKSNTWGQITNENWELMEEMIAGVVSIPLTGLSTYTLTTSDGVTSNGRHAVIRFTGATTGTVTITVSPNDLQKVYFIDNAVDQDVTLTQGSGANVTVPAGFKKIIYCNGAGAGAAVTDVTDNLSLSGTITGLVNATTFQLNGTQVTATAAELNILDGVTASTAELNILDGVTASTAELNLLDGITLTTSEINGAATAAGTSYDNTSSGLTATDVQDAIDEVESSASTFTADDSRIKTALNADGSQPIYAVRAWCKYNGSSQVIEASGNISSVTRVSAGRYRFNYTTAMPNDDYSVAASKSVTDASNARILSITTYTTGYCESRITNDGGTNQGGFDSIVSIQVVR